MFTKFHCNLPINQFVPLPFARAHTHTHTHIQTLAKSLTDLSALMEKLDKRAARAEKSSDKHFKSIPCELGDVALSSPPKGAPKWAVDASFLKIASSSTDVESGSGIDRMYSFQVTTQRSSEPEPEPESSDFEHLDSD